MLLSVLLALSLADRVPVRWASPDPKSLELLAGTPFNCLLVERPHWSQEFSSAASARNILTLGVVRPGSDPAEVVRRAAEHRLDGIVLEGHFDTVAVTSLREALEAKQLAFVELPPRRLLRLGAAAPVVGTYQGIWPGVQVQESGAVKAMPTGGPWIDTNSGFLRFLRSATASPVWIANLPPDGMVLPAARYLQAICDAAISGARWVVALDGDFSRRLLAREPAALKDWARIAEHARFFEEHKEWRSMKPHSRFALIQDAGAAAMLSGGILDMIAVKHTPVRPVPAPRLDAKALAGAEMAVTVDPGSLTPEQKEILKAFTRSGGTLLTGPPGWKLPEPAGDRITLEKEELDKINDVWQGINSLIGRSNLGARLFNVSSMLSSLLADPDGRREVLHLVNYSNYPVESIAVHLLGKYQRARLYAPGVAPKDMDVYPVDEGRVTGVDIAAVSVCATLVID
jgi:hypothetical protein